MTDLDHFLDFIAPKFQPYGSLERLYEIDGRRVKSIDQLQDGGKYVVAKKEKFRPVKTPPPIHFGFRYLADTDGVHRPPLKGGRRTPSVSALHSQHQERRG